jgi:F-type H+-transporting ATPase subunit delta
MAEPVTIARPYAEAVFKLARDKGALAAWSEALALLDAVIADPLLQRHIGDPRVGAQQLESLILGVAGDRIDGAARNLVQVLIANGRLERMPQIRALYEGLRREHEGVLQVRITAAQPIADEQLKALVARLEQKHRRKVRVEVDVDPRLIGGARMAVGDKVIDATVRGRLDAMAAALTH